MHALPLTPWLNQTRSPKSPGGLALVLAAHFAIIWAVLQSHTEPITSPPQALQVRLISPERAEPAPPQTVVRSRPTRAAPVLAAPRETPSAMLAPAPVTQNEPVQSAKPEARAAAPTPAPPALTAPRFDANYLDNPAPGYPALSRRLAEEGRVLLRVFVGADGSPRKIEVHQSSGFSRLDNVAAETVRRWRFVPARLGQEPMGAWVVVPISFSLRS